MNDEQLKREIEEALAAEPSPQFIARVRRQLENEPRRSRWFPWTVLSTGLATAAVLVGVLVFQHWPSHNVTPEQIAAAPPPPVMPAVRAPEITKPIPSPAPVEVMKAVALETDPGESKLDVLIDPREVAALKRFIHEVQDRKIDPSKLEELFAAAEAAIDGMPIAGLEPIVVEPLNPAAEGRGESL